MSSTPSPAPRWQSLLRAGRFNRWLVGLVLAPALLAVIWQPGELPVQTTAPPDGSPVVVPVAGRGESPPDAATFQLREERPGVFRSPAGLVYTRGGQHGHRVQHVLAHARDAPDRPGQHGVFGDSRKEVVLAWVDEAYLRAQQSTAVRRRDGQRTILTVDMERPVGFIGGQVGNRRGRPAARHLRLVLEDNRVITAYPFIP